MRDVRRVGLFAFLTAAISLWMLTCLKIPDYKPYPRILALEHAQTAKEADEILDDHIYDLEIKQNLIADFFLIFAYTALFISAAYLLAGRQFNYLFYLISGLALLAGLADVGEDSVLLGVLQENYKHLLALKWFYTIKWFLVFLLNFMFVFLFLCRRKRMLVFAFLFIVASILGLYGLLNFDVLRLAFGLLAICWISVSVIFTFFPQQILDDVVYRKERQDQNNFSEVFKSELDYIRRRREKTAGDEELLGRRSTSKSDEPTIDHDLVGIALSGGGIRSATFALGVLQALTINKFFYVVDYLSTVSGGGYIGCCLSSLLGSNKLSTDWEKFPFRHVRGLKEGVEIQHLRNTSNYLTPKGLIDRARIPGLLLRGILINFLVLFPYLAFAAWLTSQFYNDLLTQNYNAFLWWEGFCFTRILLILLLGWSFAMPIVNRFVKNIESRNTYERSFGVLLLSIAFVAFLESILPGYLWFKHLNIDLSSEQLMGILAGATSVASFLFSSNAATKWTKYLLNVGVFVIGIAGPLLLFVLYFYLIGEASSMRFLIIAAIVFVLTRLSVDINTVSMHSFYRDRLSQAYLFKKDGSEICQNDTLKLEDLNDDKEYAAPYHLINATLNLQASKDPSLRGRMSDLFLFSKNWCGSDRTGYVNTKEFVKADERLNVGTAMAISGAAVTANMGSMTIRSLVFLMGLFNIRLGYWLPNPFKLRQDSLFSKYKLLNFPLKTKVGPLYLIKELLGLLSDKSWYVNVSDGGHYENLGIYQLIQRKCKFIVVVDAEADPSVTFGSLAKLIRYARIDRAFDIDIDLDDIRVQPNGYSRKHCAIGKIYYDQGQSGYLLYIKASMVGDEIEYIKEYKNRFPSFPHQSTVDQFFDETQFEAYRALGYHIADELFKQRVVDEEIEDDVKRRKEADDTHTLEHWFEELYTSFKPRFQMEDRTVELEQERNELECQCLDPDLKPYIDEIFPELDQKFDEVDSIVSNEPDKRILTVMNLAQKQLAFMHNVYTRMQLDQLYNRDNEYNRGWMNLFRRWSQAPHFRRVWAVAIGTFSLGFQRFCEEALKMKSTLLWDQVNPDILTNREKHYLQLMTSKHTVDVWQVKMLMNLTAGEKGFATEPERDDTSTVQIEFPIGFAAVEVIGKDLHLLCYRLRDYYRKMRLTNRMMAILRPVLWDAYDLKKFSSDDPDNDPAVRVPLLPADFRLYAEFFKRHGFKPFIKGSEESQFVKDTMKKEEPRKDPIFQKLPPILFAHRGGALEQPESTKRAFEYALNIGTDVLEMDVQITKDHKFVVWHGPHLEKVCLKGAPLKGKHIKDFKWDDLKTGIVINPVDQTCSQKTDTMMLFEDFLRDFPDQPLNVEMKKDTFKVKHVAQLVEMLQPHYEKGRLINVVSQDLNLLRQFRILTQSKPTGLSSCEAVSLFFKYILHLPLPDMTAKALQTTHLKFFTPAGLIQKVKEKRGAVHVFLNGWFPLDQKENKLTKEAIYELLDRGVDGIMTDRPKKVRAWIDEWIKEHP